MKLSGKLVVASHNQGKVREIADLLAPFGIEPVSAGSLGLPEPEETESTFAGNAELKAKAAAAVSGLPALADDSGLSVEVLGGDPGIYSARWAGPSKDFAMAMEKIEGLLREKGAVTAKERHAWFTCALALALPDGTCTTFTGEVHGHLVWPPRGANGFGYDPVFQADGMDMTFGEMDASAKHAISHRARAFAQLVASLKD